MKITVHEQIGTGQYSVVYKGRDEDLEQDVAVKFFNVSLGTDHETLRQHATHLAKVQHPCVVSIKGFERLQRPDVAHAPFESALIMEFVAGVRLDDWLRAAKVEIAPLCGI